MQHPRWREGRLSTGFIAEEYKGGFKPPRARGRSARHSRSRRRRHRPPEQRAPPRRSPHQMGGPAVRFSDRRFASVGGTLVATRVEGTLGNPDQGHLRRRQGHPPRPRSTVDADWWPGRAGLDRHGARQAGVGAGARHPQRLRPRLPRHPRQGLRLYRARGRARRPDAGEGRARHLQAAALPDAGPGQGHPRRRRPGGEGRRGAMRGRGHEDGEHPAAPSATPSSRPSRPSPATAWPSTP